MQTLRDKLSHLSFRQACRLLGPQGERLIMAGGKYSIDTTEHVSFDHDRFQLMLPDATVLITLDPARNQRLSLYCSACSRTCEHVGAALSLILEEKLSLGLSAPPPERVPIESLSDEELIKRAIEERAERAKKEKMRLTTLNKTELWTDYMVTNHASGKSYRVALRGWERGESFCTCPDYRKNTLGTCKHIIFALGNVRKGFPKSVLHTPYQVKDICIYLKYGPTLELRLLIPEKPNHRAGKLLKLFQDRPIENIRGLLNVIKEVENLGCEVIIYPDAEEHIEKILYQERVKKKAEEIRQAPMDHPLRTTLLKAELRPYQLEGIAFGVGTGRAILADDMGLGKTIQGIGVAEMLAREANISKVLIICPASVKSQWLLEIERFTDRTCQLILGSAKERAAQYDNGCFYSVCNYEQVLRDLLAIEKARWDLIILDEGQRIKNWEAKTSQTIKALKSPYALVLTGTPLENRLEELFSVVEFIDDRRLGPAFRFYNRYRVTDDRGKVLGYKNLDALRKSLQPVLLRRTRKMVLKELPPRTTEIMRIPPTEEQVELHNTHKKTIAKIITKRFLTEMDLLRLQKALLMCRMAANSTFLVDKQAPGYSSKLEELDLLIDQLLSEDDRKLLLFSEWTTMLDLIEPILNKRKLNYVRLDGSVPQKKRQGLMHQFQNDPNCRLFVTTNAGATGLNLQAANTIINVDLPWNPAVLEQRISRAHRMGQKKPVQVFLLVTEETLEESLLGTLSAKHALSLAVLDPEAIVTDVDLSSGMEELKRRLEVLLGKKPDAPTDESLKEQVGREATGLARKERIAAAGGQLLGAAFAFLSEVLPEQEDSEQALQMTQVFRERLSQCMEEEPDGTLKMTVSLPDRTALDNIARSLARIVRVGS